MTNDKPLCPPSVKSLSIRCQCFITAPCKKKRWTISLWCRLVVSIVDRTSRLFCEAPNTNEHICKTYGGDWAFHHPVPSSLPLQKRGRCLLGLFKPSVEWYTCTVSRLVLIPRAVARLYTVVWSWLQKRMHMIHALIRSLTLVSINHGLTPHQHTWPSHKFPLLCKNWRTPSVFATPSCLWPVRIPNCLSSLYADDVAKPWLGPLGYMKHLEQEQQRISHTHTHAARPFILMCE